MTGVELVLTVGVVSVLVGAVLEADARLSARRRRRDLTVSDVTLRRLETLREAEASDG